MSAAVLALDLNPPPAMIQGAFWHCVTCDVEQTMNHLDKQLVAYAGWRAAIWPGAKCPKCGEPMAMASRPPAPRVQKPEPKTQILTKSEIKARHEARKIEAAKAPKSDAEHSLDEARARLLPFGDAEHRMKPLGELPHWVLERARSWAGAKKRAHRFASLVRDIDLVLHAPVTDADMEQFPKALIEEDDDMPLFAEVER